MSLYALLALMDGSGRTAKRTRVLVVLVAVVVVVLAFVPSSADAGERSVASMVLRSTDDGWADFSSGADDITQPESGIGPGTRIRIQFPDGSAYGCTANFLWRDQAGTLYLGTAGHCLVPDGKTATHGPDADYDPTGVTVEAMTPGCVADPYTRVEPAGIVCEDWVPLGAVAYGTQGAVGTDFGLITLPATVKPLLRASMPRWDGPHEVGTLTAGEQTFQYGHGIASGTLFASRARSGIGLLTEDSLVQVYNAFVFAGSSNPGDSGSAITARLSNNEGTVSSREAIGILTHSLPGTVFGTPVARAQELARDAGLEIDVVTVEEPI